MAKGEARPESWHPPCGEFLLAVGLGLATLCAFGAWLFG